MEKRILKKGEEIESNTYYSLFADKYDISLNDAERIVSNSYTCCRSKNKSKGITNEMNIAVLLKDKENVVLDFCGKTFFLHGEIQPFLFENCKNITVKNCVVEYDRSFVTETEIISSTKDLIRVKISDRFPYRVENGDFIITSETWENRNLDKSPMFFQLFDKETRRGKGILRAVIGKNPQIGNKPYDTGAMKLFAEQDGEYVVFKGSNLPYLEVGTIMVIAHADRKYSSIMTINCENIKVENYRIINGAGMGILSVYTKNIYIDGLKMFYDNFSHGIISNEADAIHTFSCSGDFIIKNSVLEGMIDDALNIHGNFYQVESCVDNKIIAVSPGVDCSDIKIFGEGDTIRIYEGLTMKKTKDYRIKSLKALDGTKIEITVDNDVLPHAKGDVIENITAQVNLSLINCKIGKANSHLRFQTRGDIIIRNCKTELPFYLTGDMSFWFESSPVRNMKVENTLFETENAVIVCCPEFISTKEAPYYHGKLSVNNCTFENEKPLRASYTECITFENNAHKQKKEMTIILKNCGDVIADCRIERAIEQKKVLGIN